MEIGKSIVITCLIFTIIFAVSVFRVDAIKCFQCSSLQMGCVNLTSNDTNSDFLIECPNNKTFCRKTVHTILDNDKYVRITRDCGWELFKTKEDNCYENDDDFKYEKSCQCFTDGCNSANFPMSSILLQATVYTLCLKFIFA